MRLSKKLDAAGRLLLSVNAALALLIYVEMDVTPPEPLAGAIAMPLTHVPSTAPHEPGTASTLPPLEEYREVVARPPFSPTRRPSASTAAPEITAPPVAFAVVGIMLAGNDRRVLVEHGDPPQLARLREAQEVEGWTIQAILRDRIVIVRSDTQAELKLKERPEGKR